MQLYLLRHGHANFHFPDEQRALSDFGASQVAKSTQSRFTELNELVIGDSLILIQSTYLRAQQSMSVFCQQFPHLSEHAHAQELIQTWQEVEPEASINIALERLRTFPDDVNVLLVCHNPFIQRLAEYLTATTVDFTTGTLVKLDVDFLEQGCASQAWIEHPRNG